MCDIYTAKCKICEVDIPMHLGDYETGRDEVEVICGKHIPNKNSMKGVMVWFIDYAEEISMKQDYPNHENDVWDNQPIVYVESLTVNAWKNRLQNHPNYGCLFGVPLTELGLFHYGLDMWTRGQVSEGRVSNE